MIFLWAYIADWSGASVCGYEIVVGACSTGSRYSGRSWADDMLSGRSWPYERGTES